MKTYILSDQMVRQLLANPQIQTAIPELAPYVQQRNISQQTPRRKGCGCGGKTSGELRVLGGVKEAILMLTADKIALAKQFMGVNGALKIYYRKGKMIDAKVL